MTFEPPGMVAAVPLYERPEVHQRRWFLLGVLCLSLVMIVMPATLSLLTAIFPPHERAKAIATWVAFAGAGGALGPIVSGALLESFWWGSAFLFNVPVVAVT